MLKKHIAKAIRLISSAPQKMSIKYIFWKGAKVGRRVWPACASRHGLHLQRGLRPSELQTHRAGEYMSWTYSTELEWIPEPSLLYCCCFLPGVGARRLDRSWRNNQAAKWEWICCDRLAHHQFIHSNMDSEDLRVTSHVSIDVFCALWRVESRNSNIWKNFSYTKSFYVLLKGFFCFLIFRKTVKNKFGRSSFSASLDSM